MFFFPAPKCQPADLDTSWLLFHYYYFFTAAISPGADGRGQKSGRVKGERNKKKKKTTLRHLFQYFSPSFGRITRRPPPWLSVSVREIAFSPDTPPHPPPTRRPSTLHPEPTPHPRRLSPTFLAVSLAHICPPVVLCHLERLGLLLFPSRPPASVPPPPPPPYLPPRLLLHVVNPHPPQPQPHVPLREPVPLTLPLPGNSLPFCFFFFFFFLGVISGARPFPFISQLVHLFSCKGTLCRT